MEVEDVVQRVVDTVEESRLVYGAVAVLIIAVFLLVRSMSALTDRLHRLENERSTAHFAEVPPRVLAQLDKKSPRRSTRRRRRPQGPPMPTE